MSSNMCLNSSESQYSKFIIDDRQEKTRSTQNFSKLCQNCRLIKDELEAEIFLLKDKSHQSFMQVIQVQQLHQEEMELVKSQHQEEITVLRQQVVKLEQQVSNGREELQVMQKNSKRHNCYIQSPSFLIDNIELIQCNEDNDKQFRLNESQFCQFNQFLHHKEENNFEPLLQPKPQQNSEINKNAETEEKINKLNLRVLELQLEVESLWEINQELKKQCTKLQAIQKASKNNYQSLYKESKFMADHIRTLANDKFKLQRKVKELQKQIRDFKYKGLKKSLTFQNKPINMSIKFNGSGLLGSQDFENVKSSLSNSREEKDKDLENISIPQVLLNESVNKVKQIQNPMMRSQMLQVNSNLQMRKSMPSYKKVSHISPSPNFRKPSINPVQDNSIELLKVTSQQFRQDVNRSDFMDEIRKEIQSKATLRKSIALEDNNEPIRPASFFHDITKKRSSTKH